MEKELINIIEKFLELCDELYKNKKIDDLLFTEMTENKRKFLNSLKKVG